MHLQIKIKFLQGKRIKSRRTSLAASSQKGLFEYKFCYAKVQKIFQINDIGKLIPETFYIRTDVFVIMRLRKD